MLEYEIRKARGPEGHEHAPLIILMHGRGATRHDLMTLVDYMPEHADVVLPEAPFPATPWGYGPGSAWYRFLGRNKPEPESFSRSLNELRDLLASFHASKVVLGGFSQGGTISIAYALAYPGRITGVLNFSGFLADHPDVHANAQTVAGASFFWGHGLHDTSIPFNLAIEGRAILQQAGADLTAHDYDIGHWIDPRELTDAVSWLTGLI